MRYITPLPEYLKLRRRTMPNTDEDMHKRGGNSLPGGGWGCKAGPPLCSTAWQCHKNTYYVSQTVHSQVLTQEKWKPVSRQKHTRMFTAALFIRPKTWRQPKCPSTAEYIKQLQSLHITEYYLVIKRNQLLIHTVWIDLKIIMLSERREAKKNTQYMFHLYKPVENEN